MSGLEMQTEIENLVGRCSRRPHNCKTGYFTSLIGRERQEIVQNEKCTCIACKSFFFLSLLNMLIYVILVAVVVVVCLSSLRIFIKVAVVFVRCKSRPLPTIQVYLRAICLFERAKKTTKLERMKHNRDHQSYN